MKIGIRPFNAVTDSGIIYSTMPKGIYYGGVKKSELEKADFFDQVYQHLQVMIPFADIYIACALEDDQPLNDLSIILGYAIIIKDRLEWIYIKEAYRRQGIATLLLKNRQVSQINPSNLTKIGSLILNQHQDFLKNNEKEEAEHETSPRV